MDEVLYVVPSSQGSCVFSISNFACNRTPDSSRFWPGPVKLGVDQPSYDKQFVRNYLTENGLKGKPDVRILPALR